MTITYHDIIYEINFAPDGKLVWVSHLSAKGKRRTWRPGQPFPIGMVEPVRYARARRVTE
jgi:hypothetical protein